MLAFASEFSDCRIRVFGRTRLATGRSTPAGICIDLLANIRTRAEIALSPRAVALHCCLALPSSAPSPQGSPETTSRPLQSHGRPPSGSCQTGSAPPPCGKKDLDEQLEPAPPEPRWSSWSGRVALANSEPSKGVLAISNERDWIVRHNSYGGATREAYSRTGLSGATPQILSSARNQTIALLLGRRSCFLE